MFADPLSDSAWANRSHRGWTTLASFALQALLLAGLLALPLIYTQALPRLQAVVEALPAPAPPSAAPLMHLRSAPPVLSNVLSDGRLMQPQSIPRSVAIVTEAVPPPPVDAGQLGLARGTADRSAANAVWGANGIGVAAVAAPPVVQAPLRISRIMEGNLIYRVQPAYPPLARGAGIQGTVVLRAIISKQGTIQDLRVLSGHPMLAPAAIDAVRQWRYRPYFLNNEPIEVETEITVNFVLGGG
jgi:periplasmic protein TonB